MKQLKRTIAIVCGGDSSEYEVSLRSAQGLFSFFDKDRYDVYVVAVRGMSWTVNLPDGTTTPVDRNDFSFINNGKFVQFDYAYITIHGTPGENGILQGYFELIHVPYSTSGVLVEAMTFFSFFPAAKTTVPMTAIRTIDIIFFILKFSSLLKLKYIQNQKLH